MSEHLVAKQLSNTVYKTRLFVKLGCIIFGIFMGLFATYFLATTFANDKNSSFQVMINEQNSKDGKLSISLSNTRDFKEPTTYIKCESIGEMNNISGTSIPYDVDYIDGSHNGDNYFAHTFYLKNVGTLAIDVEFNINIEDKLKGAEKAMWVRVYEDGVYENYAHAKDDGTAEPGTTAFLNEEKVLSQNIRNLLPGDIIKFTIVVWLEGDDPECIDRIRGGYVRFSADFNIIGEHHDNVDN